MSNDIYAKLTAPFPQDAYSKDSSRGFNLTSVKAQYVVERLNTVLGPLNWVHEGEYKETDEGVLFLGKLTIKVGDQVNSQYAPGFSADKKNTGDAYKSAKTDSLSKAASMFGVANDVFKGLVDPLTFKTKNTSESITTSVSSTSTNVAPTGRQESAPAPFITRTKRKVVENGSQSDDI